MTTPRLYNLARMTTATTGTGTITLGSAVTGCLSFDDAGVEDGDTVTYAIKDGSNSEIGRGVYTASGTTLTRSVLKSTNSDAEISLSGSAEVFITVAAEDITGRSDFYVNANGIAEPQLEVFRDDGVGQANITVTTYGLSGGGIIHGNHANGTKASPSASLKGDITGGIGSRPYHSGGAFFVSSPASIHWVASEDQAPSSHGNYLRFLTTPQGGSTRYERVIIADNGTLWAHGPTGTFDPTDTKQTKPVSDVQILASEEGNVSIGAFVYGTSLTPGFRGGNAGGTAASPSATQSGYLLAYLGGHGHDGTNWTAGTKAIITFVASENWTGSAQGTYISFGTTPAGSTTRAERMRIDDAGLSINSGFVELAEISAPSSPASDKARLYAKDSGGSTKLFVKDSAGTETALGATSLPTGYLSGLGISNNASDATNDIDFSTGKARSADDSLDIVAASSMTKRLDATYSSGTGNGGRFVASISDATWHCFVISNGTTVDFGFSTNLDPSSDANFPSGYKYRRVGSIIRASSAIKAFYQFGDAFHLSTNATDYASSSGRASALLSLTVPSGIVVRPIIWCVLPQGSAGFSSLALGSAVGGSASETILRSVNANEQTSLITDVFWTNTSGQIYLAVTVSSGTITGAEVHTKGWIDTRDVPALSPSGVIISPASASDMEAGNSGSAYVTPLVQQRHPSAAKAWIKFIISGGTPTSSINSNVSSLTDNGTGDTTINFTTAFSGSDYVAAGMGSRNVDGILCQDTTTAPTASAFRVQSSNGAGSGEDMTCYVTFFGDQ